MGKYVNRVLRNTLNIRLKKWYFDNYGILILVVLEILGESSNRTPHAAFATDANTLRLCMIT